MMEQRGKAMREVTYGQDPYYEIGNYIKGHITAIEDIIAVIEIDGIKTNQLFLADMSTDNYFIWNNDWWEGEENVALTDFFPVSDAQKPSIQPERGKGRWVPGRETGKEILTDGTTAVVYEDYKCSSCGLILYRLLHNSDGTPFYKFCPNCGSDMRERREE